MGNSLNEVMKLIRLVWNMEFHFYPITLFEYGLTWFKYCSSMYYVHTFQVVPIPVPIPECLRISLHSSKEMKL